MSDKKEHKTFIEPITKRRISYTDESFFVIYLRHTNSAKRLYRFFSANRIEEAIAEFYALDLSNKYRKYLYVNPDQYHLLAHEGEKVISMKCLADKDKAYIKSGRKLRAYKKKPSINLISPETLAEKLAAIDFKDFPKINGKWNRQHMANALLAYFFALNPEDQMKLMTRANMALVSEKIASAE